MVDIIVLERDKFAVRSRAKPHALLCARPVTDGLEHHLPAQHEFHRLAQLPRRCGCKRRVRPWKQLVAETRADELGDDDVRAAASQGQRARRS